MSIRGLRAVKAVADHASFANAARSLNLTSSAISMQISALEDALGTVLFDRSHRPPRLTREGESLLRHARIITEQYDAMLLEIAKTSLLRDYFRLGVIPTALLTIVPETLMNLRKSQPDMVVSVISNLSGDLHRMVDAGEIDGALMHKPQALGSRFAWTDIYNQSVVILAPPQSTETDIGALFSRYPYIRFNRSAWIAPVIENRLSQLGISAEATAEVESLEAIHKMVEMGFGITIVPDIYLGRSTGLACRMLDFGEPPLRRTIGLLSRQSMIKKHARDIVAAAFNQLLRQ